MSQEPKKMDRRKFIYAALGAAVIIVSGSAIYFVTKPPEMTTALLSDVGMGEEPIDSLANKLSNTNDNQIEGIV
ncbi:MAG: hypothetical protein ABSB40_04545 [Nitrososphaeria archaeon]|jgi:hypothetical protein